MPSSPTNTATPTEQLQALAREQQRLLDEHGASLPEGLVIALYDIALRMHEQSPRWAVLQGHVPLTRVERWMAEEMAIEEECEEERALQRRGYVERARAAGLEPRAPVTSRPLARD